MGKYSKAVEIALGCADFSKASFYANKQENKKKRKDLWLKIAYFRLKDELEKVS